jgi:hypothetical protein
LSLRGLLGDNVAAYTRDDQWDTLAEFIKLIGGILGIATATFLVYKSRMETLPVEQI